MSNPKLVNEEGGPGEGRRWPFVTDVQVLGAVDLSVAPTPLMVDVPVTQGGHWRIDAQAYERTAELIPAGFRSTRLKEPLCRPVPIERGTAESFEQRFEAGTKTAYRREQVMVAGLTRQLREQGHTVTRHAITLPNGNELRSDLFDHDTRLLVEAKASVGRASIRMAIGQLLDYERFVRPRPRAKAVLVPERPADDLIALLDSLDVAVIWRAGGRYRDNRDGELV